MLASTGKKGMLTWDSEWILEQNTPKTIDDCLQEQKLII